jgi:putative membrane protein
MHKALKAKKIFILSSVVLFVILLFGGVFSELGLVSNPPDWAPNLFMIFGCILIIIFSKKKLAYTLILCGIIGFFYEVAGVHLGFLFGSYNYTDVFNIKLFSVPIVMICAWIIVLTFTLSIIQDLPKTYSFIVGALIMVIIDLLIDPVAVHGLEIWKWDSKGFYYDIPIHNFLGWFFLSIPLIILFSFFEYKIHKFSRLTSIVIISFFVIIGILNGLLLASFIGILTITFNFLHYYKYNVKKL